MTSRRSGKGGKRGSLSKEDKALWDVFSRQVRPFDRAQQVQKGLQNQPRITDSRETYAPAERSAGAQPRANDLRAGATETSRKTQKSAAHDQNNFDQKTAKRLKSGRKAIDGRIDLHGMRQVEAHAALKRFLFASVQRGDRTVLVITGKGAKMPLDQSSWSASYGDERGVLRRMVPLWLGEPALRRIVIGYTAASVRHGGDGALYVQLRVNPREG
ncbi:MAG: Smr/MutS family protein [Hyphomicrobiaceae bacterium]